MRILGAAVIGLFLFSCGDKKVEDGGWDVVIKGKVGFPIKGGKIMLRELSQDVPGVVDSIELNDDYTFEKTLHLKEPANYQINFYGQQAMVLVLNKSNVEVNVDGNNPQGFAEIKGSPEHDLVEKVKVLMAGVRSNPELVAIEQQFTAAAEANDAIKVEEYRSQYMAVTKRENDKIAAFLQEQPASIAVMDLLAQGDVLDPANYFPVYDDAAQKLKKAYPNAHFADNLLRR